MVVLEDKDIRTEWYRTQQWLGLNKNPNGCIVVHIPSGLAARCGSERSAIRNKAKALSELELLVADWIMEQVNKEVAPNRPRSAWQTDTWAKLERVTLEAMSTQADHIRQLKWESNLSDLRHLGESLRHELGPDNVFVAEIRLREEFKKNPSFFILSETKS